MSHERLPQHVPVYQLVFGPFRANRSFFAVFPGRRQLAALACLASPQRVFDLGFYIRAFQASCLRDSR
jgi:hypothetical protein